MTSDADDSTIDTLKYFYNAHLLLFTILFRPNFLVVRMKYTSLIYFSKHLDSIFD